MGQKRVEWDKSKTKGQDSRVGQDGVKLDKISSRIGRDWDFKNYTLNKISFDLPRSK